MLADLVAPGGVLAGARASSKKALFVMLAECAAPVTGLPATAILDAIHEREKLGATGFGSGVAIPHGRLAALTRPLAVVARLDPPVPYDSLDGAPVDLAVLLLTDAQDGAEHLKTLARVSRALRDRVLLAKLRGAAGADAMLAVLQGEPAARAA